MNAPTFAEPIAEARPACSLCRGSGACVDTMGAVSTDDFVTWTWLYTYRPCTCLGVQTPS